MEMIFDVTVFNVDGITLFLSLFSIFIYNKKISCGQKWLNVLKINNEPSDST